MSGADEMSWRRAVFDEYAAARRTDSIPGYTLEVADDITRHLPQAGNDEAILWLARFAAPVADRRVAEEIGNLEHRAWAIEWKLHGFDQPEDLRQRLEARGLRAHHAEALMVLEVAATPVRRLDAADVVVKEAEPHEFEDVVRLGEEVWNCRMPWLAHSLAEMTHPVRGSAKVYCARTTERVVGTGWIEFHHGSRFAQLCGGSLLESYRGRGLYSRLFEMRLAEARRRGVPYIAVDAAPMSRPILERRGFRYVCDTYQMRSRPYEPL